MMNSPATTANCGHCDRPIRPSEDCPCWSGRATRTIAQYSYDGVRTVSSALYGTNYPNMDAAVRAILGEPPYIGDNAVRENQLRAGWWVDAGNRMWTRIS